MNDLQKEYESCHYVTDSALGTHTALDNDVAALCLAHKQTSIDQVVTTHMHFLPTGDPKGYTLDGRLGIAHNGHIACPYPTAVSHDYVRSLAIQLEVLGTD
jgi:hypothetical protein